MGSRSTVERMAEECLETMKRLPSPGRSAVVSLSQRIMLTFKEVGLELQLLRIGHVYVLFF